MAPPVKTKLAIIITGFLPKISEKKPAIKAKTAAAPIVARWHFLKARRFY
jgi:hypothetical protein